MPMARYITPCLLVCLALAAWAGDTGGYRGPNGDGVFAATGLLKAWPKNGPKFLWSANCGDGYAGPTVYGDTVYMPGGTMGTLFAYSLDGQLKMRLPFGSCTWKRWSGTRSTPIVQDGVAVCTTAGSSIVGMDLKTGEQKWQVNAWKSYGTGKGDMGWGYPESPCYVNGKVIFNACSRDDSPPYVAVDINTGKTVWEANAGPGKNAYSGADCSSGVFRHNGRNFLLAQGWRRIGLYDADTGEFLWDIVQSAERTGKPAYWNGFLWFDMGGGNMKMVKLSDDAKTYTALWSRGGIGYMQYVMLNGRIYVTGQAVDSKDERPLGADGKPVIAFPDPAKPAVAPKGSGLVCLDIATGKVLSVLPWSGKHGHIIAADGMVYTVEEAGISAFRLRLIKPLDDGGMQVTGEYTHRVDPKDHAGLKLGDEFLYGTNACPVIADGRLFLKHGAFYVFDLRAEQTSDGIRRDGMGQAANATPPINWWKDSNLLWTAALPGKGMASPVTSDGKVFAAYDGGGLACVAASSGKVLWKETLVVPDAKGDATAICTPIVRANNVFTAFANGAVGCYDLSGKLVWSGLLGTAGGATPLSSPVLSEKVVAFQGERLSALDAETGKLAWTLDVPKDAATISPAKYRIDDINVLITSWGAIVRAADGKVLWTADGQTSGATAVVADGVLYLRRVVNGEPTISALVLPKKAEEGMKLETKWAVGSDPVSPLDGMVVVGDALNTLSTQGVLTARAIADGKMLYTEAALVKIGVARDVKSIGLVVAGGMLYATINGETVVVKPGKVFERVWRYQVRNGAAEAAFAGGAQFLRGGDRLYAIGGDTPAAPVEPELTSLAAAAVPDGAPIAPMVSDLCPPTWVVAGPFAGRDLTKDYLAGTGGRAVAVPKVGDVAKLGGEESPFRALPDGAWWTGGRFTNDMKAIIVANGEPGGGAAAQKALNSTLVLGTVIENDAPRYVRFRFLTPDGISWNFKQRLDGQMWLAGKPVDDKTVYRLEKGRYPLLLQVATGDVEGWGKIWMCPRLVDCTPEIDRKLDAYRRLKAGWDGYQESLKTTFVLQP